MSREKQAPCPRTGKCVHGANLANADLSAQHRSDNATTFYKVEGGDIIRDTLPYRLT